MSSIWQLMLATESSFELVWVTFAVYCLDFCLAGSFAYRGVRVNQALKELTVKRPFSILVFYLLHAISQNEINDIDSVFVERF